MNHTLLGAGLISALTLLGSSASSTDETDSKVSTPTVITVVAPSVPPLVVSNTRSANATEIQCLARNVYFEARGEGLRGMQAVAHVTMNRVESRLFRRTVCGVVYQPNQFTWTRRPGSPGGTTWQQSLNVARAVYTREDDNDITHGATYFHALGSRPSWSRRFHRTTTIGAHSFYRA